MVDPSVSSEKSKGNLSAIVGWGSLALATLGFIWFVSTQLSVRWEGREKEALDLVKAYQGPGMKYKLDDHKIEIQNRARDSGGFVGQFSWSTTHAEGPGYIVTLTWMENSEHRRASWKANLQSKGVEPADQEATAFMQRDIGAPAAAAIP
jgi:hypothetical protein